MIRKGLRNDDVRRLAALMRGGAAFEEAVVIHFAGDPADAEAIDGWRPTIEKLASEPGRVEKPPKKLTPDEAAAEERRRLDAWLAGMDPPAVRDGFGVPLYGRPPVRMSNGTPRWLRPR